MYKSHYNVAYVYVTAVRTETLNDKRDNKKLGGKNGGAKIPSWVQLSTDVT